MTAYEIRELNVRLQDKALNTESVLQHEAGLKSLELSLLAEIAAQLAEHNAHMERLEYLAENVISINCGGLQVKVN